MELYLRLVTIAVTVLQASWYSGPPILLPNPEALLSVLRLLTSRAYSGCYCQYTIEPHFGGAYSATMYANDSLRIEDRSAALASLLTLTYVPDFQCPASYGHDPYQGQNQSRRLDGSKDLGVETKRTNRRTDGADLLASSLTRSVTVSLYYTHTHTHTHTHPFNGPFPGLPR